MSNPVGDHAGLAAPGPGQNQQGAFHMLDGGALLRVEAGEEIHFSGLKPNFNMWMRLETVSDQIVVT